MRGVTRCGAGSRLRWRFSVAIAKAELQRLKPHGLCAADVVAKATTHKDSRVLARALKSRTTKLFEQSR
jgi:hypothetical protein